MRYLAYFQSFTNTYAPIQTLKQKYEEAINDKDVVGIIIGTRPDCVSDNLLDYLETLSKQTFVLVEYGIETTNNKTLQYIHRGHTFECVQNIVRKTHKRNILTGGHIILGLPGEDKTENIKQAKDISSLELDILKIHQLQIIKDTPLYNLYKENPFPLPTVPISNNCVLPWSWKGLSANPLQTSYVRLNGELRIINLQISWIIT